jgi:hypothetical protein
LDPLDLLPPAFVDALYLVGMIPTAPPFFRHAFVSPLVSLNCAAY